MSHNYAKPLTESARLERVLARLPADWAVRIERESGAGWRVWLQPPGHEGAWSEARESLAEALEEIWRALRSA